MHPRETTYIDTEKGRYRYTLRNTGDSSARYGPCETCRASCETVFFQTEAVAFIKPDETEGYAYIGDSFGHRDCLLRRRKKEKETKGKEHPNAI